MDATEMSPRTTRNLRIAGWSCAATLLVLPALAMRFTREIDWTASDFAVAALILAIVGSLLELAARASSNLAFRLAAAIAVGCGLLQIWLNLAVGIIGDEHNPANWSYFAVVAMAIAGVALARGDARSLARAMAVSGVAQVMFGGLHALAGHFTLVVDVLFASMWALAAFLFRRAVRTVESR